MRRKCNAFTHDTRAQSFHVFVGTTVCLADDRTETRRRILSLPSDVNMTLNKIILAQCNSPSFTFTNSIFITHGSKSSFLIVHLNMYTIGTRKYPFQLKENQQLSSEYFHIQQSQLFAQNGCILRLQKASSISLGNILRVTRYIRAD